MVNWSLNELVNSLIEKLFEFVLELVNAPLTPLLSFTQKLLTEPVTIEVFKSLWFIMVYIISLFYGLFFLFSGFNFIIAGFDIEKKEKAKSWIKSTILMILFVQASWILYSLMLDISSLLSSGLMGMIDPNFFKINGDNIANFGLNLLVSGFYSITLLITDLLLGIRYISVCLGVIFFPLGLFLYFIPPLKEYGKLIVNVLCMIIFIPFFLILILLGSSMLMNIPLFSGFNLLFATSAFLLIDLIMIFLLVFVILKSAFSLLNSDVGRNIRSAIKYII